MKGSITNTPEGLIPGLVGAALGGVVVAAVGFITTGRMPAGHADAMAQHMGRDREMAAMVPVCVERSRTDPERMAHLATILQASGTGKRDALMTTVWATRADSQPPVRDLAAACLTALELPAS